MILLEAHTYEGFAAGRHDLFRWRLTCGWFSVFWDSARHSIVLRHLRKQIRLLREGLSTKHSGSGYMTRE